MTRASYRTWASERRVHQAILALVWQRERVVEIGSKYVYPNIVSHGNGGRYTISSFKLRLKEWATRDVAIS